MIGTTGNTSLNLLVAYRVQFDTSEHLAPESSV